MAIRKCESYLFALFPLISIVAPYKHFSDIDPKEKRKNHRSADGRVVTAPPNVNTNPESRNLFKFRPHMKDEF